MKSFIIAFLLTLALMLTTTVVKPKAINDQPKVTEQSILTPLEAPVYAQKQELAQVPVATPKVAPVASGDWVSQCKAWADQAGIPLPDEAIKLLERESHCDPEARNPSSSAGGIAQALPWTKMGCSLSAEDAPCQLRWFYNYVSNRYGSYAGALAHSYAKSWY